jgi:hypothetical protein
MLHFLGQSSIESVGVGILKDSSLMGVFPLPTPTIMQVSMLNMILTQVRQSPESFDPLVVPGIDEHGSSSLSRSLKHVTYPPPFKLSLTLGHVLETSFPPPTKNVPIINQLPKWGKKKIRRRKQRLGGRSPASGHHVGAHPQAFVMQVGGKTPLERHASRSDPQLGFVPIIIDPGGSRWPPTYSNWLKIGFWKLTIFSSFSGPKILGPF